MKAVPELESAQGSVVAEPQSALVHVVAELRSALVDREIDGSCV